MGHWFWICQGFEQTKVLNKPVFWIYQGSEYASSSQFARVLNMSVLHRVLNMPEYAWLCLTEYVWICLNMPGYAWICLNLPEWLFVLYFPIVIPYLLEGVVIYFNIYTKLEVLVWMKLRLFSWRHTIWFSCCKYFICFLFETKYFYK